MGRKTSKILYKISIWLQKGNFKRETLFLQIVKQKNTKNTKNLKAKVDNAQ